MRPRVASPAELPPPELPGGTGERTTKPSRVRCPAACLAAPPPPPPGCLKFDSRTPMSLRLSSRSSRSSPPLALPPCSLSSSGQARRSKSSADDTKPATEVTDRVRTSNFVVLSLSVTVFPLRPFSAAWLARVAQSSVSLCRCAATPVRGAKVRSTPSPLRAIAPPGSSAPLVIHTAAASRSSSWSTARPTRKRNSAVLDSKPNTCITSTRRS
mmetsp:Transcript_10897/g.25520  ORF Transcript_10897/g.25520 Transcript_10897/m.25520 type:complete len:213 (+) Transcript_10897:893-1531(+)